MCFFIYLCSVFLRLNYPRINGKSLASKLYFKFPVDMTVVISSVLILLLLIHCLMLLPLLFEGMYGPCFVVSFLVLQ